MAALGLRCGERAFSGCGEWGYSLAVFSGLYSAAAPLVEHKVWNPGSVVVAQRLSCSAARGIFPDQGSNLCPLHWQVDS